MDYREATPADVPGMHACRLADPAAGPGDSRMAAYLEGNHHPHQARRPRVAYLATEDQAVTGYIAGHLTRRYECDGELQYLFVASSHRRTGVATELLRRLATWFVAHDAFRICVDVNADSPAARPFYTRHGASPVNEHWLVWPDIRAIGRIAIVPYDSAWPVAFRDEAHRLQTVLGALALRIDHHGSTAVPGLAAKPIIDIQVSVASLQPLAVHRARLQTAGYVHVPGADDSFCPFFHRPRHWPHTHHVHLVESGGTEERRTLAFRDYLRDHGDAARRYEELKRALASRYGGLDQESREAYARAKSDFVAEVLALALKHG